ncbi:MAG: HAD family hydrolase [Xanthobacteraceae bacterium]
MGAITLIPRMPATRPTNFSRTVTAWLAAARHPRFDRPCIELVYQPMLELIRLLRAHSVKVYIVSGCAAEFMRIWSERVYGIPPEQVIGSTVTTRFDVRHDQPVLVREGKIEFLDDAAGKPVGIDKFIGRRPIVAFGNSDKDRPMLQWTAAGSGPRLMGLIHHTDGDREWAYDRGSGVGHLDEALGEAHARKWTIVDMKRDWKRVFAFEDDAT